LNKETPIHLIVDAHDEKLIDNNGLPNRTTTQTDHTEIRINNVKMPNIREIQTHETIKMLDEKEQVFKSKDVDQPNIIINSYNLKPGTTVPDTIVTQKRHVKIGLKNNENDKKSDEFIMPKIAIEHEVPKKLPTN
jgi:hypothetical protein